jgi:hypothetical protein
MRAFRPCIALATLLFLVACANQPTAPLADTAQLAADEAAILVRFHSSGAAGQLAIHHGPISLPYAIFAVEPGSHLQVVKIKASSGLRISTYSVGTKRAYFDDSKMHFEVRPQTITYIGDVEVIELPNNVFVRVVDSESTDKSAGESGFPGLFARYAYAKAIPR